jgi:RNA polymerase sigma-70 factor (ECF subfamily)
MDNITRIKNDNKRTTEMARKEEKVRERHLLEDIRAGSKTAFDELVLLYENDVQRFVRRYIKDPMEVLDVCQDVYLKMYLSLKTFKGESALSTWLYTVASHTSLTHLSMMKKHHPRGLMSLDDPTGNLRIASDINVASPDQELMAAESFKTLLEALYRLPPEQRSVFIKNEIGEESYDAIALEEHCPVGTVRSRLHRARALLDKLGYDQDHSYQHVERSSEH